MKTPERRIFCVFERSGDSVRVSPRGNSVQEKVCRILRHNTLSQPNPYAKWDIPFAEAIDEFGLDEATTLWQSGKLAKLFSAKKYFKLLGHDDLHILL